MKVTQPTDREIISRGVKMLRYGTLPSVLSGRLMTEFGPTSKRAGELAAVAIERHKKDTKPFDEPG
jgi:hypothetical protein